MYQPITGLVVAISLLAVSCKHEPALPPLSNTPIQKGDCVSGKVYFVNDILPIFQSKCAIPGCHSSNGADGVLLDTYVNIMTTAEIKPYKPNSGDLMEVLTDNGDNRMPPAPYSPLSANEISLIQTWISEGAVNDVCTQTFCDTANVRFSTTVFPIIQQNCLGCHGSVNTQGGVLLTDYINITQLIPNNTLANTITGAGKLMPPSGKMSDCSVESILKWINSGYPNN